MTPEESARLAREANNGILPPESYLLSPTKILLWRALVSGERFNKHAVAARFSYHLSTADRALNELHAAGKVHIVGWTRNGARGPMTKIVAFGPGEDVGHPSRLSNTFNCRRWRSRNPDKKLASDRQSRIRRLAKQGKLPTGNDRLLAAIMGKPTPQQAGEQA